MCIRAVMKQKSKKIIRLVAVAIMMFFCQKLAALDYDFYDEPPIFYLAGNHLYLEIETKEFAEEDLGIYYIDTVVDPVTGYVGLAEFDGKDSCEIVLEKSSSTYFHCILYGMPDTPLDRLIVDMVKEVDGEKISRMLAGYKNIPDDTSYSKTFKYSEIFTDNDGDGFDNEIDNCIDISNPGQHDTDGNGRGDACPLIADKDGDGVSDDEDNCPEINNPKQGDYDGDDVGNLCDDTPCSDPDKVLDKTEDTCVYDDNDSDSDGIADIEDNCPQTANSNQANLDEDDYGDACDICPEYQNKEQTDYVEENCRDVDIDGVPDFDDKCVGLFDPTNMSASCINFAIMPAIPETSINRKAGSCSLNRENKLNFSVYLIFLFGIFIVSLKRLLKIQD